MLNIIIIRLSMHVGRVEIYIRCKYKPKHALTSPKREEYMDKGKVKISVS